MGGSNAAVQRFVDTRAVYGCFCLVVSWLVVIVCPAIYKKFLYIPKRKEELSMLFPWKPTHSQLKDHRVTRAAASLFQTSDDETMKGDESPVAQNDNDNHNHNFKDNDNHNHNFNDNHNHNFNDNHNHNNNNNSSSSSNNYVWFSVLKSFRPIVPKAPVQQLYNDVTLCGRFTGKASRSRQLFFDRDVLYFERIVTIGN